MALDRFDRMLLNAVQKDAAQTAERLADEIHLSASAIQRRLKRLRDDGVIVAQCAVVDPRKVGRPSFFIVSLEVERERPELLTELRRWLAQEPHVQEAFYVTGQADFIIVVTVPDTESYDDLMGRLMSENPNIKRFTTHVSLGTVKRGQFIPIPVNEV